MIASVSQSVGRTWLVAFGLSLLLYYATADRGVQWQDSGWQQYRITTGQIEHPSGLVLYHPLHYYLGRGLLQFGWDEPAFAVTLLSCLAGALAVANVTLLVRLLTGQGTAAAFAGLTLALGHTFWQHAAHTETYTLVAALLSTEWLLWYRMYRYRDPSLLPLLGLVSGLGFANHVLASLVVPVNLVAAILVLRGQRRWWLLPAAGAAWLLGSLPYTTLIASHYLEGGDFAATFASTFFGIYRKDVLNAVPRVKLFVLSLAYLVYNFPGIALPLGAYGGWAQRSKPLVRLLLIELAIYLVFVLRYPIPDQYTFFIPSYTILAALAGVGLAQVQPPRRWLTTLALLTACWTPLVYVGAAETLRATGQLQSVVGMRPYRDGYRAFLIPWGVGSDSVQQLHRHLFELTGEDGFIVIDPAMTRFAILYDQYLGRAPAAVSFKSTKTIRRTLDEQEARALLDGHLQAGRPVVQIPGHRDRPKQVVPGAIWNRDGDLYVLEGWAE